MSTGSTGQPKRGTMVKTRAGGRAAGTRRVSVELLPEALIGRCLAGKYEVTGLVGTGGMGAVYRAIQAPLGREVAVKVILAKDVKRRLQRQRFNREAKAIARLSHSSTVRLFDFGEEADGALFMVLELIRGPTLRRILQEERRLEPSRVAAIARQVLGALAEAHALGIVHRDLKPDNMMMVHEQLVGERVKILDFGIARLVGTDQLEASQDGSSEDALQTYDGVVVGSPHYMAPEQTDGTDIGPQADLYALGAVMYELLTGAPPYDPGSTTALLDAHNLAPIPELPASLKVPPRLGEVIRKALSKLPSDRYRDAQAMAEAIDAAMPGEGAPIERAASVKSRPGRPEPPEPRAKRLKRLQPPKVKRPLTHGAPEPPTPDREATMVVAAPAMAEPYRPEPTSVIALSELAENDAPTLLDVDPDTVMPLMPPVSTHTIERRPRPRWPLLALAGAAALALGVILLQLPGDDPKPAPAAAKAPETPPAAAPVVPDAGTVVALPELEPIPVGEPDAGLRRARPKPKRRRARRGRKPTPPPSGIRIKKL